MKRWAASFAISFFLFLFHSPVFAKSIVDADTQESASSKIVSGLDANWQATPSPFAQQPGGFTLKIGNGHHGQIVFPAVLDAQNPIAIQIQKDKVQQVLASDGTYKAELVGKYLIYRGDHNSILYRYDADKQSLREFVYLKEASALAKSGDVIQWRFEGADLKLQSDGSVALTQTINVKNEVRKVSNNHMAERISRFLAKKRSTPEKPGNQTRILFTIPKPEYIDGTGKTLTDGIQYKVADAKLTLHLDPKANLTYPLWVDPSLQFRADADADIILDGHSANDLFGFSVASAGDFNGDGIDDIIVGAYGDDRSGQNFSGSAFLFLGRTSTSRINLRADSDADIIFNGQDTYDNFGLSVSSAGDFNGDGFDDIIIGARGADNNGISSGRAFIFFGRSIVTPLNLRADTDASLILNGREASESFGHSVASAGDFNADGYDDVIVGAPGTRNLYRGAGLYATGEARIFFGINPDTALNQAYAVGEDVIIEGLSAFDSLGASVASAGDFNGDGLDDVIVGAPFDDNNGEMNSGSAFIFFGQQFSGAKLFIADQDADIIFDGQSGASGVTSHGDYFGQSVSTAGDFNGDGLDDVIVGAWLDDNNGLTNSGSAFIFFGQNTSTQTHLRADADADVILNGQSFGDNFGKSVSLAGDFNGDGIDDVIIGADQDDNGSIGGGSSFVFFGRNSTSQLTLRADADADVIFDGHFSGDGFGLSGSSAGDFNGDGFDDVIIGAPYDDNNGEFASGSAFIFFRKDPSFPIISLFGGNPTTTELGSTIFSFGATAQDIVDGDITANIVESLLDTNILGPQTVTYDVVNSRGFAAHAERIVNVVDTTPPIITLTGNSTILVSIGTTYTDPGATATDNVDGDITANIVVGSLPVDTSALGTHIVTYDVTDSSGNAAHVERVVKVVVDATAPLISIQGLNPGVVNFGSVYTDFGATAFDNTDGDLTNSIVVGGLPINTNTLGTNTVTYDVTNSLGKVGHAERVINVVDITPPLLSILGNNPATVNTGETYVDAGTTALDDADGDVTANIVVTGLPIDTSVPSTQYITYSIYDSTGNFAQATRIVNVRDTQPPVITAPADVGPVEATSVVTSISIGTATATDNIGVVLIYSDDPGVFRLGLTVVTWTAVDASGNASTATQNITVQDTTPPQFIPPSSFTVYTRETETAVNIGRVSAWDNSGDVFVANNAPALFPLGTTVVTWTVTDSSGNVGTATQNITVLQDTTPPVVTAPANVTTEATGPTTPVAIGTATATDNVAVASITSNAPASFPVGLTVVTWTATDTSGNIGIATQNVTVEENDTTLPVVTAPADVTTVATGPTTPVTIGTATATDNVAVASITSNAPTSFPIGLTVVTWTATDTAGNTGTATQNVTVQDTTTPVVTAPANVTAEATGTTTTVAIGTATATDAVGIASITSNAPASFPVGLTVVTWTATDTSGNTGTATQNVTVQDTTLPVATAPANVTAEATGTTTTLAIGTATATDAVGIASIASNAPASFPVGLTVVTWTATDTAGNTGTATQNVTVQDTTPPILAVLGSNPVTVQSGASYIDAGATATDIVDGDLTASIVVGGLPINTSVAGIHTVTYNVTDASGNAATQVTRTVNVVAPAPPVTLSVTNLFDNKNGKNYFPGGPEGTDPLDDINSLGEDDKVEILGDDSSAWWEAQFADPDPTLGNPSEVLVTVHYRPESDWTGTFTVQYRVGSTVLASTTIPGNSSGNVVTFTWDLSSVVTTSADLANGRLRFLNNDSSNGKKVFVSFSSTSATLGGGSNN